MVRARLEVNSSKHPRLALDMVSFKAVLGWLLDFSLAYTTLTAWCIAYFTECHIHLICAWFVSLSDIMFFANSLGKWSKEFYETLRRVLPFSPEKSRLKSRRTEAPVTQLGRLLQITSPLAFIPYHVLVMFEIDGPGLYGMVCVLRLLWIVRTHKVSISFFSSDTRGRERTFRQPATKRQTQATERNSD